MRNGSKKGLNVKIYGQGFQLQAASHLAIHITLSEFRYILHQQFTSKTASGKGGTGSIPIQVWNSQISRGILSILAFMLEEEANGLYIYLFKFIIRLCISKNTLLIPTYDLWRPITSSQSITLLFFLQSVYTFINTIYGSLSWMSINVSGKPHVFSLLEITNHIPDTSFLSTEKTLKTFKIIFKVFSSNWIT